MTQTTNSFIFDADTLAARDYWRNQLNRPIGLSNIPLDHTPISDQIFTEAVYDFSIHAHLLDKILKLSKAGDFLIYTILTAGVQLCLHRYSEATRVVTGSPARHHTDKSCVNALPIVNDIDLKQSFKDFLLQVRSQLLDAYQYQIYPWINIAQDFGLKTQSECPLFDVAISYDRLHQTLPDNVHNAITLQVKRIDDSLLCTLRYANDRFTSSRIQYFAKHLHTLLEDGLNTPDKTLGELNMLSAEEDRVICGFNNTSSDFPTNQPMQDLIAQMVNRYPHYIALQYNDQTLTYQQLDQQANQLARYLITQGVRPGDIIGLNAQASMEFIIAVFAILKAGGVFLPLDPSYPIERLRFMMQNTDCQFLLSDNKNVSDLAKNNISLNNNQLWNTLSHASLSIEIASHAPAYLIYTSGSTGQAKGVVISHQSLCNLVDAQIKAFSINPSSRILQFASMSFDAAISEIFTTLAAGARLVLSSRTASMPGPNLLDLLIKQAITHVTLPPSALSLLPKNDTLALQTLVVAGEACPAELARQWSNDYRFINAYGPTEATVCTTLGQVQSNSYRPSIGRPIQNMCCYVLDKQGQRVPIGVAGELYIGGIGLAEGYYNMPKLTQQKFVEHNFVYPQSNDIKILRLYRSGDRVAWQPDGTLSFLGRTDNQIKVRGFRIETDEIEAVLMRHPAILQCVVVACGEGASKYLVAYNVYAQQADEKQIKAYLAEQLPPFMVPAVFLSLVELPLTPNGKVDRQALPSPKKISSNDESIAPRDATELAILQIWEALLERNSMGVRDDFFACGGSSLMAVRLMSRIQQQLSISLPLTSLFENATIEGLAKQVKQQQSNQSATNWSPLVHLNPQGTQAPLFCIHPTGGTVLCYYHLAVQLGKNRPFIGVQALGLEADQVPFNNIADMAAYYADALCQQQPSGPFHLAGWSFGGVTAFELACQLRERGRDVAFLGILDSYAPSVFNGRFSEYDDADIIAALLGGIVDIDPASLRGIDTNSQLTIAIKATQAAQRLPSDFGLSQSRRLLHISKLNYQAIESYQVRPYDGKISLFQAKEEAHTVQRICPQDQTLGWANWAKQGVQIIRVPGNHQTMVLPPHVDKLAQPMQHCLSNANHQTTTKPASLEAMA